MDGAPEIDFDRFRPTRSAIQRRNIMDRFMWALIAVAFVIACIPLISLLWTTIVNGIKRLNLNFLSYNMTGVVGGNPTPSGGYGGILHAIIGTLMILTPGIAFTMGIRDFVQGDYLSGTIRMIDALLIAASIAIGTGLVLGAYAAWTGVVAA